MQLTSAAYRQDARTWFGRRAKPRLRTRLLLFRDPKLTEPDLYKDWTIRSGDQGGNPRPLSNTTRARNFISANLGLLDLRKLGACSKAFYVLVEDILLPAKFASVGLAAEPKGISAWKYLAAAAHCQCSVRLRNQMWLHTC
jgi:hypothetical protein